MKQSRMEKGRIGGGGQGVWEGLIKEGRECGKD